MRKLVANMFIALAVLGGIPSLGLAGVKNANETVVANQPAGYASYRIPENSIHTHQVFLNAGYASISISGDGDTDLDLYVYDLNGNLIVRSESYGDDETVGINVYRTGYFIVKVINRGYIYNDYSFIVR